MARNVFISFRFSDGHNYKEILTRKFDRCDDTIDFSEDENRSNMSEYTIQRYLYQKLRRSSVTIILLTPGAVNHKKDFLGNYNDWMYDEIRYSLENRAYNKTNGLIAVYTPETEKHLIEGYSESGATIIKDVDNLFRKNMMNIKPEYKNNPIINIYDSNDDSYCSLVAFDEFIANIDFYIKKAIEKRDNLRKYNIKVRLQ